MAGFLVISTNTRIIFGRVIDWAVYDILIDIHNDRNMNINSAYSFINKDFYIYNWNKGYGSQLKDKRTNKLEKIKG